VIAGPDERQHERELKSLTTQLRLDEVVEFIGPVADAQKWSLYQSAELFVLPSLSENFGIVVAESLACGTPVLTTTGTPWPRLRSERAGWWVSPDREALSEAIREATAMPVAELRTMGSRGRKWIGSEFKWEVIASQMSDFYQWLIRGGPKPEFVV
jgi:glycosyltransferase involved in cell wall biosynthesis